jgi:MoaA/NifB/PqqE/SkfB family radical SAM enzyme
MANPYAELQERANRQARPINVLLELTYRCNYDCTFCYNPKNLRQELSTEEVFSLLLQLQEMNVLFLSLSGGEATLRRDLMEIVERARELDYAVTIFTNGHLLTREKIRRFRQLDVLNVEISLHGPTAEIHDRRVQVPGSFERLREVFRILAEEGQKTIIKCPVTKANFDSIVETWEYGRTFGHVVQFDTKITPTDEGDNSPLDQKIDPDQLVVFWRDVAPRVGMNLPNRQRTLDPSEHNCGTGTSSMVIDPYGFVYPCVQWRRPLGNVRETPVREIWSGTEVAEVRQINRDVNREAVLGLGPLANSYFSCPGLSMQKFGDPKVMDPDDVRRAEVLFELRSGTEAGTEAAEKVGAPE